MLVKLLLAAITAGILTAAPALADKTISTPPACVKEMQMLGLSMKLLDLGDSMPQIADSVRRDYALERTRISKSCPTSGADAMAGNAMLSLQKAWLAHYAGDLSADESLELAIQQLNLCASKSYGQERGATCGMLAKRATQWQRGVWP